MAPAGRAVHQAGASHAEAGHLLSVQGVPSLPHISSMCIMQYHEIGCHGSGGNSLARSHGSSSALCVLPGTLAATVQPRSKASPLSPQIIIKQSRLSDLAVSQVQLHHSAADRGVTR